MKSVPIFGHTDSPWSASNQPAPSPPAAGTHGEVVKMDRLYYKKKEIKKKCAACQA